MLNFQTALIRLVTFALTIVFLSTASAQTKLIRFPDIHGNQVAFSYAGDLWRARTVGRPRE